MKVKVTRVEIWEVDELPVYDKYVHGVLVSQGFTDSKPPTDVVDLDGLVDSVRDDVLNSQGVQDETEDGKYTYTPKEIVGDIQVEKANGTS